MYIKLAILKNKTGQKLLVVDFLLQKLDQGCLLLVHSGPQNANCIYNCLFEQTKLSPLWHAVIQRNRFFADLLGAEKR